MPHFDYTSDKNADMNCLFVNTGHNVLENFNFLLRVEGIYDVPCKGVRAFTKENEYEFIKEGGLNDYVHLKRKPISKPFTLVVERYASVDILDPLPLGAELTLPVILMISRRANDFGRSKRTFTFTGCTVMSKEYGGLDAEKSGLLTETVTISYREMVKVDLPWDTVGNDGMEDFKAGKYHFREYPKVKESDPDEGYVTKDGLGRIPALYRLSTDGTKNVRANDGSIYKDFSDELKKKNDPRYKKEAARAAAKAYKAKYSMSKDKDKHVRSNGYEDETVDGYEASGVTGVGPSYVEKYSLSVDGVNNKRANGHDGDEQRSSTTTPESEYVAKYVKENGTTNVRGNGYVPQNPSQKPKKPNPPALYSISKNKTDNVRATTSEVPGDGDDFKSSYSLSEDGTKNVRAESSTVKKTGESYKSTYSIKKNKKKNTRASSSTVNMDGQDFASTYSLSGNGTENTRAESSKDGTGTPIKRKWLPVESHI